MNTQIKRILKLMQHNFEKGGIIVCHEFSEEALWVEKNLETLGDLSYTEVEKQFAYQIQEATGKAKIGLDGTIKPLRETLENPGGGSTDVGDVSFIVPVARLGVTVAPKETPWHSWAVVACGGMSIGHKGMIYATKALGMSLVDLFTNSKLRAAMTAEFKTRKGDYVYEPLMPSGPPPRIFALS